MRGGGGGDDHGVGPEGVPDPDPRPEPGGHVGRPRVVRVGHHHLVNPGMRGQRRRVERPYPSETNQTNTHIDASGEESGWSPVLSDGSAPVKTLS
ncbi:hypothetical protein Plo01_37430 [Planobispora longispora]|uniref:Uncharacterized protein n=1 Tax=Planobispora longispora TaxID=28887 RepID=A0A8J3W5C6_9ACTN|nr:hypothetical protein Plo01_37430 [Planobispora longispora]